MSAKKRALGRGLDALLGSDAPVAVVQPVAVAQDRAGAVRQLAFDRIVPNPFQPRKHFDEAGLEDLTVSIRSSGILQPLIVRKRGEDFQIVAGERRMRAAQRAGLTEVPAIVREYSDREMLELALLENLQRQDLNAIEEAQAYQRLIEEFALTQEQVAERVGKSRVTITNEIRLLRLPQPIQEWIAGGGLSAGHGRALLALGSESSQLAMAREILKGSYSVRETERRIRLLFQSTTKSQREAPASPPAARPDPAGMADKLTLHLGNKVKIEGKANNQGRIVIYYASLDEFQAIIERLGIPAEQEI